ncbi:HoxN/HupN/NixA family nickel/cobalt transporter [Oxalobacteraceae bacterium CAVE-383]|nr:HoxN/HupN/NixA family nickel/cobalt transporter [Oxalobacteraceae bacterium CAVE-383]
MLNFIGSIFDDRSNNVRLKVFTLYAFLVCANIAVWGWAFAAFRNSPLLLASAVLAYTLGLRHAVDADHIAAIDNVTRKLMQENKAPISTGFFFSLGHSTMVLLMSVAVAIAAVILQSHFDEMKSVGGVISTSISALYLCLLAFFNVLVLLSVIKAFKAARHNKSVQVEDMDVLSNGGLLARIFRPLFRMASRSWHMFPVGFLFGLGFDTASEVALFGMSAAEAAKGTSLWTILVFPALFTAGMSLVDTSDATLMMGAYGWAFKKPIRKLYYNITITLVSVLVAVGIASIEILGLIQDKMALSGVFWNVVAQMNRNFGLLGYVIIGIFMASWIISILIYKLCRYDDIDVILV